VFETLADAIADARDEALAVSYAAGGELAEALDRLVIEAEAVLALIELDDAEEDAGAF